MKFIDKIRKWPAKKKRIFSISLAIFLTFLILILNSAINLIWKDEVKVKDNSLYSLKESISEIVNQSKPLIDQTISSSTEIIDQINSASSSTSTSTNIVE